MIALPPAVHNILVQVGIGTLILVAFLGGVLLFLKWRNRRLTGGK